MGRGAKQGWPPSAPLTRWAKRRMASHIARALACADDFCFGLAYAFRSLGSVLNAPRKLGPVTGLRLNCEECAIFLADDNMSSSGETDFEVVAPAHADEVRDQLKSMSDGKSAGAGVVVAELLKEGSDKLILAIAALFSDILQPGAELPEHW
ncbi:unnamed protein product, partial [Prorocentrum cordatum]